MNTRKLFTPKQLFRSYVKYKCRIPREGLEATEVLQYFQYLAVTVSTTSFKILTFCPHC
jgi:hypothetical protein